MLALVRPVWTVSQQQRREVRRLWVAPHWSETEDVQRRALADAIRTWGMVCAMSLSRGLAVDRPELSELAAGQQQRLEA